MDDNAIGLYPPMPGSVEGIDIEMAQGEALGEGAEPVIDYGPILESICGGVDDSQPVEQYNGSLGVTKSFVNAHQRAIGQLRWNSGLSSIYADPGNVSGARWCTGVMISHNLMLTAGHCFDPYPSGGWRMPRRNGTSEPIAPWEMAKRMHVVFDYQVRPDGTLRPQVPFDVDGIVEYRRGGLDYAIVRLEGSPGSEMGFGELAATDPAVGSTLAIIGHPAAGPKRIEAGPLTLYDGDRVFYDDIDTLGGNSGSGIWLSPAGTLIGVHTNGGCNAGGTGVNNGYRMSSIRTHSPTVKGLDRTFPLVAGTHRLRQRSSKRFLDAYQGSHDYSAMTRPEQSNDTQRWSFTRIGTVYTIRQVSSGRFLDAYTTGAEDYSAVTRGAQQDDTQRWAALAVPGSPGTFTLLQTATRRLLDAYTSGNDYSVVTRTHQGDATQRWKLTSQGSGAVTIEQVATGRFLDAHGSGGSDYSAVTRSRQGDDTQQWMLTAVAGIFTIRQVSSGRLLDAHGSATADHSVVTRPAQGDDTQRWIVEYLGGTHYSVRQLSSGRYLDAHQTAAKGFSAVTRPDQGNNSQRWRIV